MPKPKRKSRARRISPWAILAGLLVLVGGGVLFRLAFQKPALAEITVKGAPHIETDTQKIDFGVVPLGRIVRATVRVTNTGDQPMRFQERPYVELKEGC